MNLARIQHADRLVARAKSEIQKENYDSAWEVLAEAHIFSQPYAGPHLCVHWEMLFLALRTRNFREILGQALRLLLAVPGSISGRFPVGNSGRSNITMFAPMPISPRVAKKMRSLNKLEQQRVEGGGMKMKHNRKHYVTRDL